MSNNNALLGRALGRKYTNAICREEAMNELEHHTKGLDDYGYEYGHRFCLRRSQDRYIGSTRRFLEEARIHHAHMTAPLSKDEVYYFFNSAADLKRFLDHLTGMGSELVAPSHAREPGPGPD